MKNRRQVLLDCFLIFLFAAILIRPYFKAKYTDKWASIESTFIADARFLIDHWPHPNWQPNWYGGTRFDYIYPPALRYGTAVISKVTGFWPVKAYHFYAAFFYCVGIAGVYLLIRAGTGSRAGAALGAAATAMMSPTFLIIKPLREDAWMLLPLRLGVLVKYGEGPHMTALALIPFALAFTWMALEARRLTALALAAVSCAAVVSNNFYGATALAVFYPVLVWSFWITRQDKSILRPAIAIPVLAYGLTTFWLVPSYFKVTAANLKFVSEHGTTWSIWLAVVVAVAFAVATDKFARDRQDRTWAVFVSGCAVFFSLNVLGNYFFNFRVSGEPMRLVPELDMIYIMGMVTILMWLWKKPERPPRIVAAVCVIAAFATTAGYIRHAWHMFPLWGDYTNRIEYKIPSWIAKNMPDSRILPTGSVRFWYNAWHDLAQLGGGSEQGLLNQQVQAAQWEITLGEQPKPAILWMQSMGVDATYVADKRSQEIFKDFLFPQKFAGVLSVIYDDQEGNTIYRVPRRYPVRARVVETARFDALHAPRFNDDVESLAAYVDVVESGPAVEPKLERNGTDAMTVRATLAAGQSLLLQESYDPAWQAESRGQTLPIRKDALGMMVIDAPPGEHEIHLSFPTPFENKAGRVVTALTVLALIAMVVRERR